MAGYSDSAMRRVAHEMGAAYSVSEMISAAAICHGDRKTAALAKISDGEGPVILQLFGHKPDEMAMAAEVLLSGEYPGCSYSARPAGIDINMGCPVKKIVSSGDGSALMKNSELAASIAAATRNVCEKYGVPLSVKIRAGWDKMDINCAEFARKLAENGVERITVHCRTREMMYMPSADPGYAKMVVEAVSTLSPKPKVVGNGDIESVEDAQKYLSLGCDEVAIGRAAIGNPWIFRALTSPEAFTPPTIDEVKTLAIRLVNDAVSVYGELAGIRNSRSRAAYFIKGMRGAAEARNALNHAETLSEFVGIIENIGNDAKTEEDEKVNIMYNSCTEE